ncbi:MAG: 50S ribosomal protein L4 [Gammaproteobacteria bacterium]
MKADVTSLAAKKVGTIDLDESIFGVPVRGDILRRAVVWQLAKRRQGTHKVKTRGEINGSTAKIYRQKGTGRARHGNRKVNLFKGGGSAFGPVPRSHAHKLPKKVRKLALKTALSAKLTEGKLIVVDGLVLKDGKAAELNKLLAKQGWNSVLMLDGPEVDVGLSRAAANLASVDILPSQGANVYDILRCDTLVLSKAAVESLEARLK